MRALFEELDKHLETMAESLKESRSLLFKLRTGFSGNVPKGEFMDFDKAIDKLSKLTIRK